MHAPIRIQDLGTMYGNAEPPASQMPTVVVKTTRGAPERIMLPLARDSIVIVLTPTAISAFPGIASAAAKLGTMLFVPAGTCIMASFEDEHDAIVLDLDPELRSILGARGGNVALGVPETAFLMHDVRRLRGSGPMLPRLAAAGTADAACALQAITELLLHDIAVAHAACCAGSARTARPRRKALLQPRDLAAVERFIDRNLDNCLRVDDLAAQVGLSRYHFLRCFKRATGISPLQYIIAKRVAFARHLLAHSSESIAAIAYAAGFSSQSHLNTIFKRHVGVTPGTFLRVHRSRTQRPAHAAPMPPCRPSSLRGALPGNPQDLHP